ncbi:DUF1501 domain-containing protein [Stieleria sp. JC731]|uniref:DUF1501 domain-containing protein n=1 Tax=Pirellulaceae TaxID=2691357 RepID=UPI001E33C386|nr:DUF1501 domain-containing protein [Stieleria sp. JC731]MCC9602912.1 DUF1501 domain-containing protein [Stieleria sp. JC731]
MSSHHCRRFRDRPLSRRRLLGEVGSGLGAIALSSLMSDASASQRTDGSQASGPLSPKPTHFEPKARSVIFLYMDGGPSQVDTFDPKPLLKKYNGADPTQTIGKLAPTQFDNVGKVLASPWDFAKHGDSGIEVSSLFPHLSKVVDELAVVRSMTSEFSEHTSANYFLHTGSGLQGRPSMGAWFGYGLGSENAELPGFVVLNGGLIPPGGLDCFGSGFLPSAYQGSIFLPQDNPIANIKPAEPNVQLQRNKLDLIAEIDRKTMQSEGYDDEIETAIQNFEIAFRMQTTVPDLMDLRQESAATKRMYGLESDFQNTRTFGTECLVARRLVERGVRFIELTCPAGNGDRWDQHSNLVDGHTKNCRTVDQPIAALIEDLRQRGLLDSTLIVWAGEFGRTPFAQGANGRDHNPFGFTVWLAGGGIKGGVTVGETDEWGYHAIRDRYEMHDLHATMLHLMGLDHTRTTFRFSGRDMRLTDVHGKLIEGILA